MATVLMIVGGVFLFLAFCALCGTMVDAHPGPVATLVFFLLGVCFVAVGAATLPDRTPALEQQRRETMDEGREAALAGIPANANPYHGRYRESSYEAWARGWMEGFKEHNEAKGAKQ